MANPLFLLLIVMATSVSPAFVCPAYDGLRRVGSRYFHVSEDEMDFESAKVYCSYVDPTLVLAPVAKADEFFFVMLVIGEARKLITILR